jgi:16S rRNA (uracil1498-N3)-methyltransferase
MTEPRLLVEHALAAGARLTLDAAHSRHVGLVLRLDAGDFVRVFNARDGEWRASIEAKDRRGVTVQARERLRPARAPRDLTLLFAPVKRDATDLIVEKAAELGAARIQPVVTARTIAARVRLERLCAIAREAAEQCERFEAPAVAAPLPLARVLDEWDHARALLYADERGDDENLPWGGETGRAAPIGEVLGALPRGGALALLIGPEGGFAMEERRRLRSLPFVTAVSLGPRILRADTAAIAGLSVIQALWGDWGRG